MDEDERQRKLEAGRAKVGIYIWTQANSVNANSQLTLLS